MTAIKDVTLDNGITVTDAIHRIENVNVNYKNMLTYTVFVYVDLDKPSFHQFTASCEYSGGDVYSECYINLCKSGEYARN